MRSACLLAFACVCVKLSPVLGTSGATDLFSRRQEEAVRQLLRRRLPAHADDFDLTVTPLPTESTGGTDALTQQFTVSAGAVPGRVALTGTSGVALASALNHYLKYDAGVQINVWFTMQTQLADKGSTLPRPTAVNMTSPYKFQNYLNICAFGYSTAWYSWPRWQAEIDWMALNGVINPLAMVGQDAVWLDVFTEDFGLPKAELLNEFFAGPTFQPWHWMGNLNGWGGPVDEAFLRQQQSLQQNITGAMVAFGMQPVLPAFAGHVPKSMADKFPEANITQVRAPHSAHQYNMP